MQKEEIFAILGIDETKDEKCISSATDAYQSGG